MVDLKKFKEKYNELHDSYISEFIVKNEEKLRILFLHKSKGAI